MSDELMLAALSQEGLKAMRNMSIQAIKDAILLTYQLQAEQAVDAAVAQVKTEQKAERGEFKMISLSVITNKTNNIILNNYPFDEPFVQKRETTEDVAKRNLAFKLAFVNASKDPSISLFEACLDRIGRSQPPQCLEDVLRAANGLAVVAPYQAKEFLEAIYLVPDHDVAKYATLVNALFPSSQPAAGFGGIPAGFFGGRAPIGHGSNSSISKKDKELSFLIEPIHSFKKSTDFSSSFGSYFGQDEGKYFGNSGITLADVKTALSIGLPEAEPMAWATGWKTRNEFFSQLKEIYMLIGKSAASEWMAGAIKLTAEDKELGKEFATGSKDGLVAYVKDLGYDLDQFMHDFRILGMGLGQIAKVSPKYAVLGKESLRSIVRHCVKENDKETLESLAKNDLPKERVVDIARALPEGVSGEETINALQIAAEPYKRCSTRRLSTNLVSSIFKGLEKSRALGDYIKAIGEIDALVAEYTDFVDEVCRDYELNVGFNDSQAQDSLELYIGYLGKDVKQFRRDFMATGIKFQQLAQVKIKYSPFFDDDKLRPIMNYVAKKRSRDLIDGLLQNAPIDLTRAVVDLLEPNSSKKDTVAVLLELNKTYNFLQNVHTLNILQERLDQESEPMAANDLRSLIKESRKECYSNVVGDREVPEELSDMVDNIVVAFYKRTGQRQGVDVQPALQMIASTYLESGAKKAFDKLRNLDPNQAVRRALSELGADVDAYERGITRTYHVATDGSQLERTREKIQNEVEQAFDRIGLLEVEEEIIEEMRDGNIGKQLEAIDKFIRKHEFGEEGKSLKQEIKDHLHSARSITGTMKGMEADATFYVIKRSPPPKGE